MKVIKLSVLSVMLTLTSLVFAQKIVILEGSLDMLKGQKILNIEYDWSNARVGKFEKEEEYLEKKSKEYDAKEPGRGDKWKAAWKSDKTTRFQPQFERLFNKYTKGSGLYLGNEKESKYMMIVRSTSIEPGFNAVVSRKPALVDLDVKIVEKRNPDNVICHLISKSNRGKALGLNDFDTGIRIAECYSLAGKKLGVFFVKSIK